MSIKSTLYIHLKKKTLNLHAFQQYPSGSLNDSCQAISTNQFHTKLRYKVKTSNLVHSFLKKIPSPTQTVNYCTVKAAITGWRDLSSEITEGGKQGHNLSIEHYITLDNTLMDAIVFVPQQNVLVNRYVEIKSDGDVHLPDYWKGIHPRKGLKDSPLLKYIELNSFSLVNFSGKCQ